MADRDTRRRAGRCGTPTRHAAKTSPAGTTSSPSSTSEINSAGMRGNVLPSTAGTAAPLDQAAAGRPAAAQARRRPPHGRQDLHRAGRQDLPAVAVHHAHLPVLRARQRPRGRRSTRTPTTTRGGARRAALRRALRPVHAEPAPLRRLRRAVLRRGRTATAPRAARPHRHARHRLTRRTPRSHRRDLSPGVVAVDTTRSASTAATCRSGTRTRPPTSIRRRAKSCRPGTRHSTPSATMTTAARRPVRRPLRRARRPGRVEGREPVHRLPHQVPDQARRRLPPGRDRRPGAPRRPARRRAPLRAVLADLRELAPLRHPAQERQARMRPGACKGKAHRREYLGYAGRRVLVSRKWSGKTLADHRADRKNWLIQTLGLPATDPAATPGNPSPLATTTTCPPRGDCCTSSPTASAGNKHSTEARRRAQGLPPDDFRQPGGGMSKRTDQRRPSNCCPSKRRPNGSTPSRDSSAG